MKGGVGLFEGLGIDTENLSKMTRPLRNDGQGQMARPTRNHKEIRSLVRKQGQLAKEHWQMEEFDELRDVSRGVRRFVQAFVLQKGSD